VIDFAALAWPLHNQRMLRRTAAAIVCAVAFAVAACGIKGPLKPAPVKPAVPAATPPATPSGDGDNAAKDKKE
jgi:predicted small lipoprotein YifL